MELFDTECYFVLLYGESSLWIDKKTAEFTVKPAWELANGHDPECIGVFFGLVGCIKCPNFIDEHIILIKESILVGELPSGHAVHKIKSIALLHPTLEIKQDLGLKRCPKHHRSNDSFIEHSSGNSAISKTWSSLKTATTNIKTTAQQTSPLQNIGKTSSETKQKERYQRRITDEVQRIFTDTDSFYFCPAGGDITNSVYRQYLHESDNPDNFSFSDSTDDRFFWNKHMLYDIIKLDSALARVWIMPIIQGYVEIKDCKLDLGDHQTETFTISLISRRSRHRVGTRYKRRGVDVHGHCANYVETEQLVKYKKHVVSFIQVRGSIPLYWSQQGYKYRPPPQLHKTYDENQAALKKHITEEIDHYGPVVIVNLVERTGKEAVIGDAYADHICTFNHSDVTYVTFDFHHYCHGLRYENVSLLIDELQDEIARISYCWIDNHGLISKQNGVFRVNCVDCLDRTNVVQTAIAREVLIVQMVKLGLMSPEVPNSLFAITQQMWANNGDVISKQYAGTNALKGDITRTGGRKLTGMMKDGMNSASRYYLSRFKDTNRQATLDIMLGNSLEENIIQQKDTSSSSSSEDEADGSVNEDEKLCTIDHIKQVIEDVKKLIIEDPSLVITAWGLLSIDYQNDETIEVDMDTILVLTHGSYFVAEYDTDVDRVIKYEEILLKRIRSLEIVVWNTGNNKNLTVNENCNKRKKNFRKQQNLSPTLNIHYTAENLENTQHHSFRSTNVRFFNNIAVPIKSDEEKLESLKAVAETIQATCEVCGLNDVEYNVKLVQRKGSLLSPETYSFKPSEIQLSSLKNVGSKALSNVSQQFNRINDFSKSFKFGKIKLQSPLKKEFVASSGDGPATKGQETFLSTAGIVLSNTYINPETIQQSSKLTTDDQLAAPVIIVNSENGSNSSVSTLQHGIIPIHKSNSDKNLSSSLYLALSPNDGGTYQSLKSGFTSATSSIIHHPSSPLSKLAKGVQHLGYNLDPRKSKQQNVSPGNGSDQQQTETVLNLFENSLLKEKWTNAECKSKLIAL